MLYTDKNDDMRKIEGWALAAAFLIAVAKCGRTTRTTVCQPDLSRRYTECKWRSHDAFSMTYEHEMTVEEQQLIDARNSMRPFFDPVCGNAHATSTGWTKDMREGGSCSSWGSLNRNRQLIIIFLHCASAVLQAKKTTISPLADSGLAIHNTQAEGPIHENLKQVHGINHVSSEYFPNATSGKIVGEKRQEDLQNLTMASRPLDLFLSTEVFEHITDPYRAHREIYRVLRAGGSHVLAVPFGPVTFNDDRYAELDETGVLRWD